MNPWCSVLFNLFSVQSGNASRFLFYLTVLSPATFARKGGGGNRRFKRFCSCCFKNVLILTNIWPFNLEMRAEIKTSGQVLKKIVFFPLLNIKISQWF